MSSASLLSPPKLQDDSWIAGHGATPEFGRFMVSSAWRAA